MAPEHTPPRRRTSRKHRLRRHAVVTAPPTPPKNQTLGRLALEPTSPWLEEGRFFTPAGAPTPFPSPLTGEEPPPAATWRTSAASEAASCHQNLRSKVLAIVGNATDTIGDILRNMFYLTEVLLAAPLIAGSTCIALSIFRLVIITTHKYGGEGADASNTNVLRALILFYALVLAQGALFHQWRALQKERSDLRDQLCLEYQFQDTDKRKLIDKYITRTSSACMENGVLKTINRNLVSFALDLLQSEYSQDRISAVLVLHTLLTSQDRHKAGALAKIQSSPDSIAKMLDMLSSKRDIDQENKTRIAQIFMELSSELQLSKIPGAIESISSLIDPYLTKISTPSTIINNDQQISVIIRRDQQGINHRYPNTTKGDESKPLIVHGLLILAKLAVNPDNCTEIYHAKGLFSKITAPISNKSYTVVFSDDITAIEIVEKSLVVVSKLVSGTDEINKKICQAIYDNGLEVNSIHPILSSDPSRYSKLKVPAIKILTKLVLGDSTRNTIGNGTIHDFINVLMDFFFDGGNESDLRRTAGKALALLAMNSQMCSVMIMNGRTGTCHSVVHSLSAMLSDTSNRLYGTAVAQLLLQFCANLTVEQAREHLAPIKTVLHEVLKIICNVEVAEASTNQLPDLAQRNPSSGQTVVQFFLPCLGTSSSTNRNRPHQSRLGSDTLQNQTPEGSRNQREDGHRNQRPAQRILSEVLCFFIRLIMPSIYNAYRRNRNIGGGNAQGPVEPASSRRKTLVAFLGLAVQMCGKLIDANDLDAAVAQIPLSPAEFVEKLKDIIELCNKDSVSRLKGKGPSVDYLAMIKSVTKLCTWVMRSRPSYVAHFQEKEIGQKLEEALEAMRPLELAALLTCSADEIMNYQTLSSVVEDARSLIQSQQP